MFEKYFLYTTNILRQNDKYAINIIYYLIFKKCFEFNHITNLDIEKENINIVKLVEMKITDILD